MTQLGGGRTTESMTGCIERRVIRSMAKTRRGRLRAAVHIRYEGFVVPGQLTCHVVLRADKLYVAKGAAV